MNKLVVFLTSLILLCACSQENYESGDGPYSRMIAEFADVYTNHEGRMFSVFTDDGDSLLLTAPQERKWAATPDSVYRVLLYYNKVEHQAEMLSVSSIPTPLIRKADEIKEGVKTDPVRFTSSWKSRNGRYMNLGLTLMTGSADGNTQQQMIGCVCDSVTVAASGRQHVWLTLYHDQGGVPEYYSAPVYVSIKTSRLPVTVGEGDQVSVTLQTYDGKLTRTFDF